MSREQRRRNTRPRGKQTSVGRGRAAQESRWALRDDLEGCDGDSRRGDMDTYRRFTLCYSRN